MHALYPPVKLYGGLFYAINDDEMPAPTEFCLCDSIDTLSRGTNRLGDDAITKIVGF